MKMRQAHQISAEVYEAKRGILLVTCNGCKSHQRVKMTPTATFPTNSCHCGGDEWIYDREAVTVGRLHGYMGFKQWVQAVQLQWRNRQRKKQ